jgi:hypothetical protein
MTKQEREVGELNKVLSIITLIGLTLCGFFGFLFLANGEYTLSLISFIAAFVFLGLYNRVI